MKTWFYKIHQLHRLLIIFQLLYNQKLNNSVSLNGYLKENFFNTIQFKMFRQLKKWYFKYFPGNSCKIHTVEISLSLLEIFGANYMAHTRSFIYKCLTVFYLIFVYIGVVFSIHEIIFGEVLEPKFDALNYIFMSFMV